ncbi:MAG: NAD(P)H-dependent oxidoreductase [Thiogranum sp.]|jgi:FMN-dependent NADH-azoreductase|nr:NAD(P)H-dependent oxidoreductase [Thiogranum sp.]
MTTTATPPLNVLHVDASGRYQGSVSRALSGKFIETLRNEMGEPVIRHRDVARGLPFVDADWIGANFTPAEQRSEQQQQRLAESDALVGELVPADVIVIGTPVYNFSIPASLKAWVDLVARAGLTFRYTENGPVGLLEGKKAYVIVATGGTPVGSDIDFASGYLRHLLGFIGIDDVTIIGADRLMQQADTALAGAEQQIVQAVAALRAAA